MASASTALGLNTSGLKNAADTALTGGALSNTMKFSEGDRLTWTVTVKRSACPHTSVSTLLITASALYKHQGLRAQGDFLKFELDWRGNFVSSSVFDPAICITPANSNGRNATQDDVTRMVELIQKGLGDE